MTIFANRGDAARQLADRLLSYKDADPMVLALPRGGVPIGFEVAKALDAPLDLVLVRKIGAPGQPELAVGAVVDGPQAETVINDEVVEALGIPQNYIAEACARELEEIERRRGLYLAGRPRADVVQKTAIVVDDGIATGATVRAALHAVRRANPGRLVLAVPVAPPETVEELREEVDDLVCLATPAYFDAIGSFYIDFRQVSDAEVVEIMEQSRTTEPTDQVPTEPLGRPKAAAESGEPSAVD